MVLGLYVSSADSRNAYAAIVAGVGVLLTAHLTTDGKGFGMWTPSLLGLLASAAAGGLSLLVFRRSLPETSNPKI